MKKLRTFNMMNELLAISILIEMRTLDFSIYLRINAFKFASKSHVESVSFLAALFPMTESRFAFSIVSETILH